MRPTGSTMAERLQSLLVPRGGCLVWTGSHDRDGYGRIWVVGAGHETRTHVLAWSQANGRSVLPGLQVCHACDTPPCCDPAHLFLADAAGNQRDKVAKGRQARGAGVGTAVLTEGQVLAIRAEWSPYLVPARVLAERYGVGIATVERILQRRTWAHL